MGFKIFAMLFVMGIVFIFAMVCNLNALSAMGDNNEALIAYLKMEQIKGSVSESFQQMQLYANLVHYKKDTNESDTVKENLQASIDGMNAGMEEMRALVGQLNDSELNDTYTVWQSALDEFQKYCAEILSNANAGSDRLVNNQVNQLASYQTPPVQKAAEAYNSLLEEKRERAQRVCSARISGTTVFDIGLVFAFLLISVIVFVIMTVTVTGPAKKSGRMLQQIIDKIEKNEGDLTERVPVKTKDEIGVMSKGINGFLTQLQGIMQKLKAQSENMLVSAQKVGEEIKESTENAEGVSASMESMSASMEEMSATLGEIAAGSDSVLEETRGMAEQVGDGVELVGEIRSRAQEMHQTTIQGKESTGQAMGQIRQTLQGAVEESRSVEQINELTGEILKIASQTNLLALNASIEAARAGETGRGFAVVADEIRELADSTRDTANNIQSISSMVTGAVERLANNAEEMMHFINDKVMKDYDSFVQVAEQYEKDADSVNGILSEFARTSDGINDTVHSMNTGINDISVAVDENARDVTSVAQNTVSLVEAISNIQKETENSRQISAQLSDEVNRFKKV